jgi:hypothetical protein
MKTATTKLTKAPHNNRFHSGNMKTKREKGERLEDQGNRTSALYIDGKFRAIVKN